MLLDDLLDYMSSDGGVGTAGTDIFAARRPDEPDAVTVIYETQGLEPIHTMGSGPGSQALVQARIQIVTRDTNYADARTQAQTVINALDGLRNRTINGVEYKFVRALHDPFQFETDTRDRPIIACNFEVLKAHSTS